MTNQLFVGLMEIGHYKVSTHAGFQIASWKWEVSEDFPTRQPEDSPSPFSFFLPAASQSGRGSEASMWGLVVSDWDLCYLWENLIKFQNLIIILFGKKGEETEATCFFHRPLCLDPGSSLGWRSVFLGLVVCTAEPLVDCIMGCSFSHWVIGYGIWRAFLSTSQGTYLT